jgi:hypothetical protein
MCLRTPCCSPFDSVMEEAYRSGCSATSLPGGAKVWVEQVTRAARLHSADDSCERFGRGGGLSRALVRSFLGRHAGGVDSQGDGRAGIG